ncbi:hypothetical protein JBL43_19585 [Aureibaculum sp. A20]|uniref:DUF4293 family protein n=1 Tax=Aureibaculum flavum TaxID=2795986 RepID=A0ABS0WWT4_9FLAO|nr:hypothetical protein [Aureibaculum flavum]MBJ2176462.1 hypothetical protein [Aureibaculum flavum]
MKKELILLVLGGVTSIFLIKFDLQNGFEFLNYKIQYSLIDYAGESSTDQFLTTQIISYFIFLAFIISIKKRFTAKNRLSIVAFLMLLLIGMLNESVAIYENSIGEFVGRHCRIGNILTIIGTVFLISTKQLKTQ